MSARRVVYVVLGLNVIVLFAGALWLRTFSLASIPEHNGDESYHGLQALRLLRGESFATMTPSGNILSPLYIVSLVPFTLALGPSIWTLRLPAVVSGLLAVALAFGPGSKALDRKTALMAATVLMVLPPAILYSRLGLEYSQTPLVGIIAALFALRGMGGWLLGCQVLALLVHPTNIFLMPMLLPVYLVQAIRHDPLRWRRTVLRTALASAAIAVPFAVLMLRNPIVSHHGGQPRDWLLFFDSYGRLLSWTVPGFTPERQAEALRWAFRIVAPALVIAGGLQLARSRRWERLALLVGLIAGLSAFHLAAGSETLDGASRRYGAVLVVPTALVVACLIEAVVPAPIDGRRRAFRFVGVVVVLAGCWLGLLATRDNGFGPYLLGDRDTLARFWTRDRFEDVLATIQADREGSEQHGPGVIVAQDLALNAWPLEYLALRDRTFRVVPLVTMTESWLLLNDPSGEALEPRRRRLISALRQGAYAVSVEGASRIRGGGLIEETLASSFSNDDLLRWHCPPMVIYRLNASRAESLAEDAPNPTVRVQR